MFWSISQTVIKNRTDKMCLLIGTAMSARGKETSNEGKIMVL
jgi:hypothetical protein